MDEKMMQQILQLVQAASQGNQQAVQLIQLIQQAAQQGDLQATAIMLVIQQMMTLKAAKGAKLNYIKRLNGICPEGYKTEYHKMGGQICQKCVKAEEGMKATKKAGVVEDFKNKRKMEKAKCGSKLKK